MVASETVFDAQVLQILPDFLLVLEIDSTSGHRDLKVQNLSNLLGLG